MKDILNLYKYRVYYAIMKKDVKIIFAMGMSDDLRYTYSNNMDIMNLCLALNKEFNISKLDNVNCAEVFELYITVDKNLGYKILKSFLDNTDNLDEIKRIDDEYAKKNEKLYGKTCFSDYIENYKKSLEEYVEKTKTKVKLDIFNLYTKNVKNRIIDNYDDDPTRSKAIITITPECCYAIDIYDDEYEKDTEFNIIEISSELKNKYNISYATIPYAEDCCDGEYVEGLELHTEDLKAGYNLLKAFLDNTDMSLLDDESLVYDVYIKRIENFKTSINEYKEDLEKYKEFCKRKGISL